MKTKSKTNVTISIPIPKPGFPTSTGVIYSQSAVESLVDQVRKGDLPLDLIDGGGSRHPVGRILPDTVRVSEFNETNLMLWVEVEVDSACVGVTGLKGQGNIIEDLKVERIGFLSDK